MLPGAVVGLPLLLCAAAVEDLRRRRIPNVISLGGALMGLALWTWSGGLSGLWAGTLGWMVGAGLFLPVYLLRGMGAGDVKLMGTVGVFLGARHCFWAALTVFVVGGVVAAIAAFRRGRLAEAVADSLRMLWKGASPPKLGKGAAAGDAIPYGLAIAAGTLLYLLAVLVRPAG